MRRLVILVLGAALIAGCAQRQATVLGQAPEGAVLSIASVQSAVFSTPATVRGTMVEK